MAAIVPVYCEFEQLKKIIIKRFNEIEPSEEAIIYPIFIKTLLSHSYLMWDLNKEQVIEKSKTDALANILLKKSTTGGSEFTEEINIINQLKSNPEYHLKNIESAIYLLNETTETSLKYSSFTFQDKHCKQIQKAPYNMSAGKNFSWKEFLGDYLCSRYLFLQDNYLIETLTNDKLESFIEIIKAFISKDYVGEFKLYILHFIEDEKILNIKKVLIQKTIKDLGLKCNISVSYHKGIKKELHDRNFVTNYCVVSSGQSTDFLKKGKSTRGTTLTYFHIAQYPEHVKKKQEDMFDLKEKYS